MNNFRVTVSNQRVSPYRLGEADSLQIKVVLNNNEKLSYLEGVTIDLYLNFGGSFFNYSSGTTNEQGIAFLNYNTNLITETIDNCLGYVKITVNSQEYISNIVRFNFIGEAAIIVQGLELYPAELMLYSQDIITM